MKTIETQSINALRILSAEAIQKANSGHPGLPLGCAPMAYELWAKHMSHNPANPKFENRDRFILSAGHGSSLLYSLLHLFGYGLSAKDLSEFRQLGSLTPGHPEYAHTVGVETSTGPLGQGVANAVGFALAESMLATKFNRDGLNIVDHYTYALTGDGCMMEGIESESASLAGTWKLGKLIVLYDKNNITIEGDTDIAFTEDVAGRHIAQGWQVIKVDDGNDIDAIGKAIEEAKAEKNKPSLIIVRTVIGCGSPKAGSADCHGAPLGLDGLNKTKENLGWTTAEPFAVSPEIAKNYADIGKSLSKYESDWNKVVESYKAKFPKEYAEYRSWMDGKIDESKFDSLYEFPAKADATRNTSFTVLNKLAEIVPNLVGGSADLAPSNKSNMKGKGEYGAQDRTGRNMHFGIREHAMAGICNGAQLHGGLRLYCATFFVFADYMKNAMRMASLMNLPITYILTHDSIGVGEDGPTHQPIEQLISLRSTPNLKVFRPADGKETAAGYEVAMTMQSPTALVLSRQNLPQYENSGRIAKKGGYILSDSVKKVPDIILMASGSEVATIMDAKNILAESGIDARVVSMPCFELFDSEDEAYRESVLPKAIRARIAVEAASSYSWHKYVGLDGEVIGLDRFGLSAPPEKLFELFGITPSAVADKAKKLLGK